MCFTVIVHKCKTDLSLPGDYTAVRSKPDILMLIMFVAILALHYENMPIQIYWKFYNQKRKIFR